MRSEGRPLILSSVTHATQSDFPTTGTDPSFTSSESQFEPILILASIQKAKYPNLNAMPSDYYNVEFNNSESACTKPKEYSQRGSARQRHGMAMY